MFRLRQEVMNLWLAAVPPQDVVSPPPPSLRGPWPAPEQVIEALRSSRYRREVEHTAERILAGHLPMLGFELDLGAGALPRWRRDALSGRETDRRFFRRIPYLNAGVVGDHKVIWELNRHQHWILLAQAYRFTGRPEFAAEVERQWLDWRIENPFQRGINWCSALEVAFRALSWIWVYHLLAGQWTDAQRSAWVADLAHHGWHLEYNLSHYFSPNTHLLGEAVALHAIGELFPELPRAARWRALGHEVVTAELSRQVQADGSHFEQSTYYQVYALDFFLFHYLLSGRPQAYEPALRKMADYLDALLGPGEDAAIPFLGDDDGGRFFHPYGDHARYGRATIASCALLFQRWEWMRSPDDLAPQASWWLSEALSPPDLAAAAANSKSATRSRVFATSGTVVFNHAAGQEQVVFDAGPFGAGTAGHSHSDTLSICFRRGGEELLVDAGTYRYVGDDAARNWFRGTAAHNTIRIDGRDQAVGRGPFGWDGKPEVKLLSAPDFEASNLVWEAEAECRSMSFRHRRRIRFAPGAWLEITDRVEGDGSSEHEVEQFWHCGVEVTALGGGQFQLGERTKLTLIGATGPGQADQVSCHRGHPHGWRSRAYGVRVEAPVILRRWRGRLPLEWTTRMEWEKNAG